MSAAVVRRSVLPLGPPPAAISGGLRVKDRPAAERELAELLTRTSGVQVARRVEAGATTVDIVVPRAAVAAFLAGLPRIGSWRPDAAADALPGSVSITIRIAD